MPIQNTNQNNTTSASKTQVLAPTNITAEIFKYLSHEDDGFKLNITYYNPYNLKSFLEGGIVSLSKTDLDLFSYKTHFNGDINSKNIDSIIKDNFKVRGGLSKYLPLSQRHFITAGYVTALNKIGGSLKLIIKGSKDKEHIDAVFYNEYFLSVRLMSYHLTKFSMNIFGTMIDIPHQNFYEPQGLFDGLEGFNSSGAKLQSILTDENVTKINTMLSSFSDLSEKVSVKEDQIINDLSTATSNANELFSKNNVDIISGLLSKISNFTESNGSNCYKLLSKILMAASVCYSISSGNKTILAFSTAFLAYAHRDCISELPNLLSYLPKFEDIFSSLDISLEEDDVEPQSAFSDLIGADLATTFSMLFFGQKVISGGKDFSSVFREFNSVKGCLQSTISLLIRLVEIILKNIGLETLSDRMFHFVNDSGAIYTDFSNKVFKIDQDFELKRLTYTWPNYEMLHSVLKEGEKLLKDLPRNQTTSGLYSTLNSAVARLRNYRKAFADSGFMVEGLRQEPIAILLRGGPGTLKTQTMHHLAHALASYCVSDEEREAFEANPELFIYNRQVETEYWDGFTHSKYLCLFDDFLQMRDMAGGGDSEVFNIIRAVNENAYDLHMASLDNKGSVKFRAHFVICTTNSADLSVQSIHDNKALFRRFKYVINVYPKDEFKDINCSKNDEMSQRVDFKKLPLGPNGITTTNPDLVLDFKKYNLFTKKTDDKILSFTDLVGEMIESSKFSKSCYEQKLIELKARRQQYAEPQSNFISNSMDWLADKIDPIVSRDDDVFHDAVDFECQSEFMTFDSAYYFQHFNAERAQVLSEAVEAAHESNKLHIRETLAIIKERVSEYSDVSEPQLLFILDTTFGDNLWNYLEGHVPRTYLLDFMEDFTSNDVFMSFLPIRLSLSSKDRISFRIKRAVSPIINSFNSIKESVKNSNLGSIFFNWNNCKNALKVVILVLAATNLFKGYKILTAKRGQSGPYKMKGKKSVPVKKGNASSLRKTAIAAPQASLVNDSQGEDIVRKMTRTNLYEFSLQQKDGSFSKTGYIFFVKGNMALIPHHFMDIIGHSYIEDESVGTKLIRLTGAYNNNGVCHQVDYTVIDFLSNVYDTETLRNQDLGMFCPPDFNPRPDAMKFLATAEDLGNLDKSACMMASLDCGPSYTHFWATLSNELHVKGNEIEEYVVNRGLVYRASTRKGDCGAIIAVMDPSESMRKIFGIHVAGRPAFGQGYCALFCREEIQECMDEIPNSRNISIEPQNYSEVPSETVPGEGRFGSIRRLEKAPSLATKSKIIPSNLYGLISEPFKKPSHLKPVWKEGELVDPKKLALRKYSSETPAIDRTKLQTAADMYRDFLFHVSTVKVEKKILTFEEAIVGIPGTSFDCMNRSTSPGYPAVVDNPKGYKGKTIYFGNGDEFDLTGDYCNELREFTEKCISDARQGIRNEHIFLDCLKDEPREIEKVDAVKTRLISASPIGLLVLNRQYFGSYMTWFQENRINNSSAIGVNVFSDEWQVIANKMHHFSPRGTKRVGAGDFSSFDGTEKPAVHNRSLDIINEWYNDGPENALIRSVLWLEVTNSYHVEKNELYEWYTSLPSGHPLTPIVNTMYNGIAFRFCWNDIFEGEPVARKFDENCYMLALGDDNIFSVGEVYSERFNEKAVGNSMSKLGLIYTSEVKGDLSDKLRDLTEIEFLKRKWSYNSIVRRYVAPLRFDGILETLNWTKRGKNCDLITESNVDGFMREASLHGEEVFSKYSKLVADISLAELDYHPKTISYVTNLLACCDMEVFC